jgi:hypothetical protein
MISFVLHMILLTISFKIEHGYNVMYTKPSQVVSWMLKIMRICSLMELQIISD